MECASGNTNGVLQSSSAGVRIGPQPIGVRVAEKHHGEHGAWQTSTLFREFNDLFRRKNFCKSNLALAVSTH
jgi:hypothetical protein